MTTHLLAQVNIARMIGAEDNDVMAPFMAALDSVNALAESSPGYIWRLKTDQGNATAIRAYDDDRILFNLSVWQDVDTLRNFVYKTMHADFLKRRKEWFSAMKDMHYALWWIPADHVPSVVEARERLEHLHTHGPTKQVFTFAKVFEPQ
jgi:hypothetical protein